MTIAGSIDYEKLKMCKYSLEISIIDAGELTILDDFNIINYIVENDYRQNFFPIISLKISISRELYHRIQIYRNQVKFRIVVRKYEVDTDEDYIEELYMPGSRFSYSLMYDSLFQPMIDNIEPFLRKDLDEGLDLENINMNRKNLEEEKEADFEPLELFLFNLNNLNTNKKIFNAVLENCSPKNAVGYILGNSGLATVLMNSPDNEMVYDQILLTPNNLRNSIEALDNVYGIYDSPLRQFLDLDMYYLLSSDLEEVPVRIGEYENVYIHLRKFTEPEGLQEGCYKDNENMCYVISTANTVSISNKSTFTKEIDGNVYKVADLYSIRDSINFSKEFSSTDAYDEIRADFDGYDNDDKTTFIYNHLSNPALNDFVKEKEEDNLNINIAFTNVDLEMLTLNKRFFLIFEDIKLAEYNGIYRLHNMIYGIDDKSLYAICDFRLYKKHKAE